MITYAAYGSNMDRHQMLARTGNEAEPIGTALLQDWQLEFRRGVLTVMPKSGAMVPLALWRITEQARQALDRYEGAPWLYAPRMLPGNDLKLTTGELPEEFLIYEMTADGMNSIDRPDPPGATYFETCMQGYFDFGLEGCRHLLDAARERALKGVAHG